MAKKYEIRQAENSAGPVIIHIETGMNVLALDTSEVDEVQYTTPIFASQEIAQKVERLLNGETDG